MEFERRKVLAAMAATPAAAIYEKSAALAAAAAPHALWDSGYFLSRQNPISNIDQRLLEDVALRVRERPEIQRATAMMRKLWGNATAYRDRDQASRFDGMIDEFMFNLILRTINSDGSRPRILRISQPPHHWYGHDLPGSRWGGDSPNFTYRIVPISAGGKYEIHGAPTCALRPTVTYTLMEHLPSLRTIQILDSLEMDFAGDGTFTITLDQTPAMGRRNHIRTGAGEYVLMIRDALGDWMAQSPNALRVFRRNPPDQRAPTEEELAVRAADAAGRTMFYAYYTTQSGNALGPNLLGTPVSSGDAGGMATQWGSKGVIDLAEDEALVIRANAAGAQFRDTTLCDAFFVSLDYWNRTSSLSMSQMEADDDGYFTYVVAHQDPGVHNWLDTGGLNRTIYGHRWQAFEPGAKSTPTIEARKVKFADLGQILPDGVRRIDPVMRRKQLSQRLAGFRRRFIEN